ncbi:UvrD-helicase domain-containing protein [Patescibacteria group bacterium]|nr:UvrD-helicase domain-containing protein [Patescibacteria group bacterium]MBU1160199.1 UvrD-helicase domain-containing protein [Patescibacteria group bacterium]MBU1350092.1 UvrD-helicase domain-containing protein [Patescibacteria group bacterium]MBU1421292.1 UvrD-helicase domain-containing protein [Patescibacteria group bacterium]MBU1684013.1 UvrD-helicase domain-containing protein [Patescibacteria group bacterium]
MEFNELQQKIVSSVFGAYLILAPVGTGKTTTLAQRVAAALNSGIKPEEIICLTFTNRAAEEMFQKIKKIINKKEISDNLTVKTFHGFCAYFIKVEAKRIGIPIDFIIFDEADQIEVLKNILEDYPEVAKIYNDSNNGIHELIDKLYKYRLNQVEREIGLAVEPIILEKTLIQINNRYILSLCEQNALDFNELVITTLKALYLDKKIKNKWAKRYKFIQLDEFQDTHISEYLVIKELAKIYKNIAFIGDLDQTIYGWRGSEPYKIIEIFLKHFAPVQKLYLEINYRFSASILGAVQSFLTSLRQSATKKIISRDSETAENKCIQLFGGYNLNEEVSWIIDNIKKVQTSEPKAKIAVLTRANYLINDIAEIFETKGIAHITVDKFDFFKRQEIKDIYAYLKIIFNKFDIESAFRLVLRPPRNIGIATLKTIREKGALIGLKISDFLNFKNYCFKEPFSNLISKHDNGRIIVIDTETTGTNVLKDEIIQIYAVEIINGKPERDFCYYLKNTISVGNSEEVHGLTDEFLKHNGKDPAGVLSKLKQFIGNDIVVGHNIIFDVSMIIENAKRHKIEFGFQEYYDTLDLSKRFIPAENYKLNTLATMLNLTTATHDAQDDVKATVGLLQVLIERLKKHQSNRIALFKEFSKKFIQLSNLISSWENFVKEKRPDEALCYIWENSGLKGYYENDKNKEKRFKSIKTLIQVFKEKDNQERSADIVMRELIHYASLVRDINFLGLDQGKIPIVTVHQVKGLEFDYVFIAGMNEFKFPIFKASNLEEEKRLFYVAMTRACKKIFISYSNFDKYNRPMNRSPFISYIDQKYIDAID